MISLRQYQQNMVKDIMDRVRQQAKNPEPQKEETPAAPAPTEPEDHGDVKAVEDIPVHLLANGVTITTHRAAITDNTKSEEVKQDFEDESASSDKVDDAPNTNNDSSIPADDNVLSEDEQGIADSLYQLMNEIDTHREDYSSEEDYKELMDLINEINNNPEKYPNVSVVIDSKEDQLCDITLMVNGEYKYNLDDVPEPKSDEEPVTPDDESSNPEGDVSTQDIDAGDLEDNEPEKPGDDENSPPPSDGTRASSSGNEATGGSPAPSTGYTASQSSGAAANTQAAGGTGTGSSQNPAVGDPTAGSGAPTPPPSDDTGTSASANEGAGTPQQSGDGAGANASSAATHPAEKGVGESADEEQAPPPAADDAPKTGDGTGTSASEGANSEPTTEPADDEQTPSANPYGTSDANDFANDKAAGYSSSGDEPEADSTPAWQSAGFDSEADYNDAKEKGIDYSPDEYYAIREQSGESSTQPAGETPAWQSAGFDTQADYDLAQKLGMPSDVYNALKEQGNFDGLIEKLNNDGVVESVIDENGQLTGYTHTYYNENGELVTDEYNLALQKTGSTAASQPTETGDDIEPADDESTTQAADPYGTSDENETANDKAANYPSSDDAASQPDSENGVEFSRDPKSGNLVCDEKTDNGYIHTEITPDGTKHTVKYEYDEGGNPVAVERTEEYMDGTTYTYKLVNGQWEVSVEHIEEGQEEDAEGLDASTGEEDVSSAKGDATTGADAATADGGTETPDAKSGEETLTPVEAPDGSIIYYDENGNVNSRLLPGGTVLYYGEDGVTVNTVVVTLPDGTKRIENLVDGTVEFEGKLEGTNITCRYYIDEDGNKVILSAKDPEGNDKTDEVSEKLRQEAYLATRLAEVMNLILKGNYGTGQNFNRNAFLKDMYDLGWERVQFDNLTNQQIYDVLIKYQGASFGEILEHLQKANTAKAGNSSNNSGWNQPGGQGFGLGDAGYEAVFGNTSYDSGYHMDFWGNWVQNSGFGSNGSNGMLNGKIRGGSAGSHY